MKLLICTQAVDKNHPVLGFFHRWLEEFALHCETVEVICLEAGRYDLPTNVTVHSLGKEREKKSTLVYSWRLLRLAWELRGQYGCVFVHMIPEYVVVGAPVWKLYNKPISLWYTHGTVSWSLHLAELLVKNIFTAAKEGMNLVSKKVLVTGHGVDIPKTTNVLAERDLDLLTVGRITPTKKIEVLIEVLEQLQTTLPDCQLTVVGAAVTEEEQQYLEKLKQLVEKKQLGAQVMFVGAVPHTEVSSWLSRAKVFVHAAENGSLDKVLLEAIAAGTPVVSSAEGAKALPLQDWQVHDKVQFASVVQSALQNYPAAEVTSLQEYVKNTHSLKALIENISKQISTPK